MSAWFSDFLVFSLSSSVVYLVGVAHFGWFGLLVLVFSCVHSAFLNHACTTCMHALFERGASFQEDSSYAERFLKERLR